MNSSAMNLDKATTQYDAAFGEVSGLTWLPWVGHRYSLRPSHQRLIIVGESHYYRGDTPEKRQVDREGYLKDPQSTRDIVSQALVNCEWTTRTLETIPKLLFKTTEIDRPRLWADCAYYNLVQRPMDYNHGNLERPSWDDFVMGWRVFAEVVRILQPSHCLFIGVSAANSFNHSMASQNLSFEKITWTQQVGRTYARIAKLEVAGMTTELMFVQHLGKYFSWLKWHDYLQNQHAGFMRWLGAESYPISRIE
jgi:hypothetical protein